MYSCDRPHKIHQRITFFTDALLFIFYSKRTNIFLRLPRHHTQSDELVSRSARDIRCSIFKLNGAPRPSPFCRRHWNKMADGKKLRGNVVGMFIEGFLSYILNRLCKDGTWNVLVELTW